MKPRKPWVAGSLATAVLTVLAGCFGETNGGAGQGVENPTAQPEFDEGTGAIVGQVLTEDELPIVAATVGILDPPRETLTDPDGRFALNKIPPANYDVHVVALGFKPTSKAVSVQAGQTTEEITFLLEGAPCEDCPYSRTLVSRATLSALMWKVTPECIYTAINPLVKTCGGIRFDCEPDDACEVHTREMKDFTNAWETILGELDWEAQSGVTGKGFHMDVNAPNITRGGGGSINQADPYTFKKSSNVAPIIIRIDKGGLAERGIAEADWNNYEKSEGCTAPNNDDCDWFYRLFAAAYDAGIGEEGFGPDYGIMYESTATVYFTYYIRAPAPADFSALPK